LYRVEVAPVDVGRVNPVYQDQENLIFHGVQVTVNKKSYEHEPQQLGRPVSLN